MIAYPADRIDPAQGVDFLTVIWFWVRVPVLSEQMTVVEPRVSTAGRLRMMARRLAMRETPIARVTVSAAGRPSGMAADRQGDGRHERIDHRLAAQQADAEGERR